MSSLRGGGGRAGGDGCALALTTAVPRVETCGPLVGVGGPGDGDSEATTHQRSPQHAGVLGVRT